MNGKDLVEQINSDLKIGEVLNNPGSGTSTILSVLGSSVVYKRGITPIKYFYDDIILAYDKFKNKLCTTKDLKEFNPKVYGSKGCNSTFFFQLLERLDLTEGGICRIGHGGSPFCVKIK